MVFSVVWPLYPVRAALASLFFVILTLDFLVLLARYGKPVPQVLKRLLWTVGVTFVLFHGFRCWLSLTSKATSLMSDPFTSVTFLSTMVFAVLWAGALFLIDSSRLQARTEEHAQDLQRLNTLKDRVMAMTSHDLRGPLGNLRMLWGELSIRIRAGACVEIDSELFQVVDRSLAGTLSLLENLFAFAEHQGNRIDPDARADLALVIHDVLEQWGPSATTKQVELVCDSAKGPPVRASFAAAVVVVRNVVGNAVKFTPPGGRVSIRVSQSPGHTALEVIDTGMGMSPELLRNLLRWEHRTSRPGTAGERGSGFGLVLVRELVEDWGGSVEIQSQPFQGTTVRITFVPVS
jgi:signal transduction histidine kinase